jgi:hypothetical protein
MRHTLYEKEIMPSYVEDLDYFVPEGHMRLQGQTCPQSAMAARATGGNQIRTRP